MLAVLLFLLPSNICGSKEDNNFKIETENLPHIDVSDRLNGEDDYKTNGLALKSVASRVEAGELTDNYWTYPLCGDKPMYNGFTCYCGNHGCIFLKIREQGGVEG